MSNQSLQQQFSKWFDLYADPIFRHCYVRLHDRERAIDLMQETFMRSWSYITRGGEIREPRAFLYKTANNLIINEYERRKHTSSLEKMDEETGYEPSVEADESVSAQIDASIILKYLAETNQEYRDILVMRYIDDLTINEIAQVLDETENNISVRIHRAMKKLRDIVQKKE